jgi:hypothetical protein
MALLPRSATLQTAVAVPSKRGRAFATRRAGAARLTAVKGGISGAEIAGTLIGTPMAKNGKKLLCFNGFLHPAFGNT